MCCHGSDTDPGLGSTSHKEITLRLATGAGYPEFSCYHVEAYSCSDLVLCGSGAMPGLERLEDDSDCNR